MKVSDLQSIRIKLASPEEILSWSHGEVLKPETINYRTQRPEKEGLFCEKIFGPSKDYECYCGKYKGVRYKGVVCDRCGVEIEKSQVRRERMGHIKLATPCSHIWFLRGVPSRIGAVLDVPSSQIEKVIYFAAYIITKVDEGAQKNILQEIEKEYKSKAKILKTKKQELERLKEIKEKAREEVLKIKPLRVLSEGEYRDLSLKYGEIFEAGMGSETLRDIFKKIDFKKEIAGLKKELAETALGARKNTLRRLRFFQGLTRANIRPEWMFFTHLPVLPPELRPMVQLDGGRYASSDLNDLYRRVINRNNRLKYLLEIAAPEVIVRNERRMLQEAVDALLDNGMRKGQVTTATTGGKRLLKSLADILEGKQGRFRRNLLGKRVDYSGRSVIAVGPELKLSQCGLPKIMALELFRPFVIKKILDRELAYNIRGASKLVEEARPEVFAILEEIVQDKLVLLNRAPTLHRLGIQAFQPVLIEGESIKVHPLVCKAYNADFDGDQMAVYLPLSDEAQQEAKNLMFSVKNLLKPTTGTPIVAPSQDIILGCYFLTQMASNVQGEGKVFSSFTEALLSLDAGAIDLRAKIKVPLPGLDREGSKKKEEPWLFETTAGRIIFNSVLPEDHAFVNKQMDSKALSAIISRIFVKKNSQEVQELLDKIKEIGFEYATLSSISWGMDDLIVPKEKKELVNKATKQVELVNRQYRQGFLTKEEKSSKIIGIWQAVKEKVEELVRQTLPKDGPVVSIVDSGARGSWAQPVQMTGMKGLVSNPAGRIIEMPIKNSFKEGFDVLEFFISTHGARKGTADTALRTSASGYLTRRLADVAHEVIVSGEDCGDRKGRIMLRSDADDLGQDFRFKIAGRISLENIQHPKTKKTIVKKDEIIDWEKAEAIEELAIPQVRVRTPLGCKTLRGICRQCYGWEMGRNELCRLGEAVGIIAAQSIGEPGTQLTMRTFHLGGVAGGGDITQGLPRVEEIFELRDPKGEAIIVLKPGNVQEVNLEKGILKIASLPSAKSDVLEYRFAPGVDIFVKKGDVVKDGQQISGGSLNPKKLFRVLGVEETQRYIVNEVQRIYAAEGVDIHDKHLEVIAHQMFSRVRIKEEGTSFWLPGQIVSGAEFQEVKEKLEKEGGVPPRAVPVLLGISRVALTSESFLSAASFQETSRILIRAALEGQEDKLRGLKENVMIGRLIPAGTGFRK